MFLMINIKINVIIMNKLYDKIYEAVNTGIQKALIISDDQS